MQKSAIYPILIVILSIAIAAVFLRVDVRDSKAIVGQNIQESIEEDTKKIEVQTPVVAVVVEEKPQLAAPVVVQTPVIKKPIKVSVPKATNPPVIEPQPIPAPAPVPPPAVVSCDTGSFSAQFLCLLNEYRKSKGLNQLTYDGALNATATDHSTWMNSTATMSHIGENGSKFYERCQQHGTTCDAENVAMGYNTAKKLFEAWKASPGHNANMLGSHTKTGLALVGKYATSLFK